MLEDLGGIGESQLQLQDTHSKRYQAIFDEWLQCPNISSSTETDLFSNYNKACSMLKDVSLPSDIFGLTPLQSSPLAGLFISAAMNKSEDSKIVIPSTIQLPLLGFQLRPGKILYNYGNLEHLGIWAKKATIHNYGQLSKTLYGSENCKLENFGTCNFQAVDILDEISGLLLVNHGQMDICGYLQNCIILNKNVMGTFGFGCSNSILINDGVVEKFGNCTNSIAINNGTILGEWERSEPLAISLTLGKYESKQIDEPFVYAEGDKYYRFLHPTILNSLKSLLEPYSTLDDMVLLDELRVRFSNQHQIGHFFLSRIYEELLYLIADNNAAYRSAVLFEGKKK